MAQPDERRSLADRLRGLRVDHRGGAVTQARLALALGVSTPSISSWESGAAVPPAERLRDYALAFASDRTFADGRPQLLDESDLTTSEERRRQDLIDELVLLRDRALRPADSLSPDSGALGGRFWYFPDGAPVRIISNPLWESVESRIPYANRWHPNYIQTLHDADADATIELYGHLRAENPTADIRYLTADQATHDDLTGHVIVLGQADHIPSAWARPHPDSEPRRPSVVDYFIPRLELPFFSRQPPGGDVEFDTELVVTMNSDEVPTYFPSSGPPPDRERVYRPRFLRQPGGGRAMSGGYPLLEYDVAFLVRARNELNLATTVTICSGVFSRGTLGAVRALTDPRLRVQNELFLRRRFDGQDSYWVIFYVPMFRAAEGIETVTPDLQRPFHLLSASV